MRISTGAAVVLSGVGVALAMLVSSVGAGPLDPPAGPVSPTESAIESGIKDSIERGLGGVDLEHVRAHSSGVTSAAIRDAGGKAIALGGLVIGDEPNASALTGHEMRHDVQSSAGGDAITAGELKIIKPVDFVSPKLLAAMCSQEPLSVTITQWVDDGVGGFSPRIVYDAVGARVRGVRSMSGQSSFVEPNGVSRLYHLEEVTFSVEEFVLTHEFSCTVGIGADGCVTP